VNDIDTYGTNHRRMMKEILSKSAGERRARYWPRETFWHRWGLLIVAVVLLAIPIGYHLARGGR
jgi:hypothetical protein